MKTGSYDKAHSPLTSFRILQVHEHLADSCAAIQKLAAQVYGSSSALPVSLLKSWYRKNPAFFKIALASNDAIGGYISALPLLDHKFGQTTGPDFNENSISAKDIDRGFCPAEGGIFISSIAVAPDYQEKSPVSLLLRLAFIEELILQHPGHGDTIRVSAQALSPKGEACMGSLGLQYRGLTDLGWKIYYASLEKNRLYSIRQELQRKFDARFKPVGGKIRPTVASKRPPELKNGS